MAMTRRPTLMLVLCALTAALQAQAPAPPPGPEASATGGRAPPKRGAKAGKRIRASFV